MTINFDADARALFNLNELAIPCWFTENTQIKTGCIYDAPGKDINLGAIGVSSQDERIEFATSTLPGITVGTFVTVDLTPVGGVPTRYMVRNVTPQDDGITCVATLKRVNKS